MCEVLAIVLPTMVYIFIFGKTTLIGLIDRHDVDFESGIVTFQHPDRRLKLHYENLPMQYTEIFKVVKNGNFQ